MAVEADVGGLKECSAVRSAILDSIERTGDVSSAVEPILQRALWRVRVEDRTSDVLPRLEAISCLLARMRSARLEGRVNAYRSGILRIRQAASAL